MYIDTGVELCFCLVFVYNYIASFLAIRMDMEIKDRKTLGEHFVRSARKNWSRACISDSTGQSLSYGSTLTAGVALADKLEPVLEHQEKVGILLPASVPAALANIAVTLQNKVPVNLNYVTSPDLLAGVIQSCGIANIITSRRFIEKSGGLQSLPGPVFLEDINSEISIAAKLKAHIKARLAPVDKITCSAERGCDELATIIFSSGSSGRPKGVMLSHYNIVSNIRALVTVFDLRRDDNLCAVLPFFHSFGFTCSLWLPLVTGVSAGLVANPLDCSSVAQVAGRNRSTILFATPSFLVNYSRRIEPKHFSSLRAVVVGAEKMKKRIADAFENRFGIRPFEGYGTTELSPVACLNIPEHLSRDVSISGHKEGTVGRAIPEVDIKIVHPENNSELPAGAEGLLMVKGPSVMLGYLNDPDETDRVLKDGWYNTGDMARLDADGFLTITGRLSRFSKIAGEMVPHLGLEQIYLDGLGTDEQLVAVTSIPSESKGEELVVLYLEKAVEPDRLHKIISASNIPNLWKPRRQNYIKIESMPALGSGKLDIVKLRKLALNAKRNADG